MSGCRLSHRSRTTVTVSQLMWREQVSISLITKILSKAMSLLRVSQLGSKYLYRTHVKLACAEQRSSQTRKRARRLKDAHGVLGDLLAKMTHPTRQT